MKKIALTFIFSVLVLMLALPASGRDLKVLYWNIQNGMWADQENNYDNFVEYVKSQDPDICVWCEAESRYRTGTNVKMTEYDEFYLPWNWDFLARRYGHQYVLVCGKRDTFPQVITSKYPVRIVKRVNGNGDDVVVVHGAGWAQVEVGGKEINIVTLHTWPQRYAYRAENQVESGKNQEGDVFRAKEMKYICDQTIGMVPDAASQYWMMLGDFNAVSRVDNSIYGLDEDNKAFLVHDYVSGNTPYIDIVDRLHPGDFQKSTFSGRRIDFIYMTEPLFRKVRSAEIIHDGYPTSCRDPRGVTKFCYPSDHYPIIVNIKF